MRVTQSQLVPPPSVPTEAQRAWLFSGLNQPGGKLPLYDAQGQRIPAAVIASCLQAGWVEPWVPSPTLTAVRVCRLTATGKAALEGEAVIRVDFSHWKRDTSSGSLPLSPTTSAASVPVPSSAAGLLLQEPAPQRS